MLSPLPRGKVTRRRREERGDSRPGDGGQSVQVYAVDASGLFQVVMTADFGSRYLMAFTRLQAT